MQKNSKKHSILVMDDPMTNEIVSHSLSFRNDVEVFFAQSGFEVISLVSKHTFCLAIIEIDLLLAEDFGLREFLQSNESTKNLPIIFVSNWNSHQSKVPYGYENGPIDFLLKPIDPILVRNKINIFLELYTHKNDLKDLETKFRKLLDSSSDAIILINDHGLIEMLNDEAEKMFGYDRVEIIDKKMSDLVPESQCEAVRSDNDLFLFGKGLCLFGRHKDGTEFSIEISLSLLHLDSRTLVFAAIKNTSVRYAWEIEREKLLTQFKQNQIELERSVMLREEFMSIAGHELKTPITALKLRFQLRLKKIEEFPNLNYSNEKLATMFQMDIKQANRLTELIEKILDITRINSGKISLKYESFNMGSLIEEVVERQAEQLKIAGSAISLNLTEKLLGSWDKTRIDQVVTNLLSNAIKYGGGKEIGINLTRKFDLVYIEFVDKGVGIAPANLKRIFKRFERAVNSDISGFGLGLYIVTQIMDAHKGNVLVESILGEGSKFILSLPIMPAQSLSPMEIFLQDTLH